MSLFIALSSNLSFIEHFAEQYVITKNIGFLIALLLIILAINALLISILYVFLPLKWSIAVMVILAAITGYFSDQFGVVIDIEMIRNSLQTDVREASDLFTFALVLRLMLFAMLPILVLSLVKVKNSKNRSIWRVKTQSIGALLGLSFLVIVICISVYSAQFSSFIRQHKELRYYINPIQSIYSGGKYLSNQFANSDLKRYVEISDDAQIPLSDIDRELIIMVVGETARADHFSLNGYARETNPLLSKETNLINYPKVSSCGTSTSISVPCMFSLAARDDFDIDTAANTENAFDIIAKGKVSVLWRDNNSDSKGVAIRQLFKDFKSAETNNTCDPECRDIGMLTGLQAFIDKQPKDVLIVLHQMGSHGPAYYKRYPKEFEKFTPTCQTAELSNCTNEEIINAYDNSILYTDYFLSKVIDLLKANATQFQTSMLYMSDHGESLGENGIYLHGLPYAFAPTAQTHVPAVFWTDKASDIDIDETRKEAQNPTSHDALAKTLITLFELETDVKFNSADNLVKFKHAHGQ